MARETLQLGVFRPILSLGAPCHTLHRGAQLHRLPRAPFANAGPCVIFRGNAGSAFARHLPVARHHGGKRIEFEVQVGMPGGDHFVVDEFFLRAKVAGQALLRSPGKISRVVHPSGDGLLVRPVARCVRAEPRGGRSVAALATDAFVQVESFGARFSRNVERVAGQTFRGLLGFSEAQDSPHALARSPR